MIKDKDLDQGIELLSALYTLRLENAAQRLRRAVREYAVGKLGRRLYLQTMVDILISIPEMLKPSLDARLEQMNASDS